MVCIGSWVGRFGLGSVMFWVGGDLGFVFGG